MTLVYLISCENFLKIGKTTQTLDTRISGMTTGNPFNIKPLFTIHETFNFSEQVLHLRFKSLRHKGEWFHWDESIISAFADEAARSSAYATSWPQNLPKTAQKNFDSQIKEKISAAQEPIAASAKPEIITIGPTGKEKDEQHEYEKYLKEIYPSISWKIF